MQKKDSVPVKVTDPDSVQGRAYPDRDSFQEAGSAIPGVETTEILSSKKKSTTGSESSSTSTFPHSFPPQNSSRILSIFFDFEFISIKLHTT
jgi:hypothetical protein